MSSSADSFRARKHTLINGSRVRVSDVKLVTLPAPGEEAPTAAPVGDESSCYRRSWPKRASRRSG